MEEIYRLAVETGATSRGSLVNTASDLGMYVSADQAGTALAWARAARAACRGRDPARAAYLSRGGLRTPGRKGGIATRVAAALVAADAGGPLDGVKAAYLHAVAKKYNGLDVQAADHANRAVWLVGLVKKRLGGQLQPPGAKARTPQAYTMAEYIRGAAAELAAASGAALAPAVVGHADRDAFACVPDLLPLRDRLSLAFVCRAACSSASDRPAGDLLGGRWMGQWIATQRAAGAAKAAAQASAAAEMFLGSCSSAVNGARAVQDLWTRTWVAWTCTCGRRNEAPCRDAAEAGAATVCDSCHSAWIAVGDRLRCRCLVPVPGGSTQREDWLAEVITVGPPPHRPAPAHSD